MSVRKWSVGTSGDGVKDRAALLLPCLFAVVMLFALLAFMAGCDGTKADTGQDSGAAAAGQPSGESNSAGFVVEDTATVEVDVVE